MDREFQFLPGDPDRLEGNLELKNGNAALLFIKGVRKRQNDALRAVIKDGVLYMVSSDGAGEDEENGEMAKWVVEFGMHSMQEQLRVSGHVDVVKAQMDIHDGINERNSLHKGMATGLCVVIDGKIVEANRVGDGDTRQTREIYPHPDLFPESHRFSQLSSWWESAGRTENPLEITYRFSDARRRLIMEPTSGRTLTNIHTGEDTNQGSAIVTPRVACLTLDKRDWFIAGTDGLEVVRLNDWYESEMRSAFTATDFLTNLWTRLERQKGENASGVAFHCTK